MPTPRTWPTIGSGSSTSCSASRKYAPLTRDFLDQAVALLDRDHRVGRRRRPGVTAEGVHVAEGRQRIGRSRAE